MSCPRQKQVKNTLRFHSVCFYNSSPGGFFQVLLEESLNYLYNFKKMLHDSGCHFSLFFPLSPYQFIPLPEAQTRVGKPRILGSLPNCISSRSLISLWAGLLLCRSGRGGLCSFIPIYKTKYSENPGTLCWSETPGIQLLYINKYKYSIYHFHSDLHFYYFRTSDVLRNAKRRWFHVLMPIPPGNGGPGCNFCLLLKLCF